jgi:hypothetical protein
MSIDGLTSLSEKLIFTPLHRTMEIENIHAQSIQNDIKNVEKQLPTTRNPLVKHLTVIGDGSDMDIGHIMKK